MKINIVQFGDDKYYIRARFFNIPLFDWYLSSASRDWLDWLSNKNNILEYCYFNSKSLAESYWNQYKTKKSRNKKITSKVKIISNLK